MHARYYSADLGRFLSVDSQLDAEKLASEPQGWNRYAYVGNNPLSYVDITGRERLQPYHFHRQPVPDQGFLKELVTVGKPAAFLAALMLGPEAVTVAASACIGNPAACTAAVKTALDALTPGPGGEMPNPEAIGAEIGERVAGMATGKMDTMAKEITELGMSQEKAAVAVDSAVQAMGLRTTGVMKAGEDMVVASVRLGSHQPVMVITAGGVVRKATATISATKKGEILISNITY